MKVLLTISKYLEGIFEENKGQKQISGVQIELLTDIEYFLEKFKNLYSKEVRNICSEIPQKNLNGPKKPYKTFDYTINK